MDFSKKLLFAKLNCRIMKNDNQCIRMKFLERFEVFSTLETIIRRYFEHTIEKIWNFHQVFTFSCFLLLKWAPKPSDRVACSLKIACAHPRGAVKKLRYPMVPKIFLKTLWVMYYNILEPPKDWRSPHLSRAREVWQSISFWLLLQAKSIGLVLKLVFACKDSQKWVSVSDCTCAKEMGAPPNLWGL